MAQEIVNIAELEQVLQEYAKEAEELYKYQIALGRHNASRKLTDSVTANVIVEGTEYAVTLTLQNYWKYLEGGSKGTEDSPAGAVYPAHFPPPYIIEQWINVKPVIPRPDEKGHIPSPKELSYAIAHSIEKHGIKPFPALEQTKKELSEIYAEKIAHALCNGMENYIRKVLVGIKD